MTRIMLDPKPRFIGLCLMSPLAAVVMLGITLAGSCRGLGNSAVQSAGRTQATGNPPARLSSYAEACSRLERLGRSAVQQCAVGDAKSLFARFGPTMARAVPEGKLRNVLQATLQQANIGKRVHEYLLPAGARDVHRYTAVHAWGSGQISITILFVRNDTIESLLLAPEMPLPPDPMAGYKTKTVLRLPFKGEWWVFWGGETIHQNYHVLSKDQRHAIDFAIWKDGATHRGDGSRNEDFWAWGQAVLAPADATVVNSKDGVPDNPPGPEHMNRREPFGNFVLLDFGNGEYAAICHLKNGSLRIRSGQRVRTGEEIGLCGNSGNTSEPHIHFHLQNRGEQFGDSVGLPLAFENHIADGKQVERGSPVQGQFIRQMEP